LLIGYFYFFCSFTGNSRQNAPGPNG